MIVEKNEVVNKFISIFCANDPNYIEWWNEIRDYETTSSIYIADHSKHTGILLNDVIEEKYNLEWKTYIYNGYIFKSNEHTLIEFDGRYFSGAYMDDILNKFFKDNITIEIALQEGDTENTTALIFKIDKDFSLTVCNMLEKIEIEGDNIKMIVPSEEQEKQIESVFINGKAVFEDVYYNKPIKRVVYKKEKIFTLDIEGGDSLAI